MGRTKILAKSIKGTSKLYRANTTPTIGIGLCLCKKCKKLRRKAKKTKS
jgi:hypothetical protein